MCEQQSDQIFRQHLCCYNSLDNDSEERKRAFKGESGKTSKRENTCNGQK